MLAEAGFFYFFFFFVFLFFCDFCKIQREGHLNLVKMWRTCAWAKAVAPRAGDHRGSRALAPSRPRARALAPSRPRALAPSRPRALAPSRPRALAPLARSRARWGGRAPLPPRRGPLGGLRIWLMGQRAALVDISIMLDGVLVRVGPSPGKVGDGDAARRSCRAVPADSRGACVRAVMAHIEKVRQVQMTRLTCTTGLAWRSARYSRQDLKLRQDHFPFFSDPPTAHTRAAPMVTYLRDFH